MQRSKPMIRSAVSRPVRLCLWLTGLLTLGGLAAGCDTQVQALGSSDMTLIASVPDNPDACPEQPSAAMLAADQLSEAASCSEAQTGTHCIYTVPNGWMGYVCGCYTAGLWHELGDVGAGGCPTTLPSDGTSCDDTVLGPCPYYPGWIASCDRGAWKVWDIGLSEDCPNLDEGVR